MSTYRVGDRTATIALVCDGDLHVGMIAWWSQSLRELVTVEDCLRWYEQSPQDEVPA